MHLWLDDIRPAPRGWTWAQTVEEAKQYLTDGEVEMASLDHDLGPDTPTGYDLCVWMAETKNWPTVLPKVHSMNPVGKARMEGVIARYWEAPRG